MGHNTQRDAANELQAYAEYFDSACSSDIKLFLCSLYAPYCNGSGIKVTIEFNDFVCVLGVSGTKTRISSRRLEFNYHITSFTTG